MTKNLKYIVIPALTGILFASCNNAAEGPSPAEMDAKVEAKVKEATDKMKADCDAQIMSAAQLKKDSILVASGKMKAPANAKTTTTTTTKTTSTTKTTTEPVKVEPVKTNPVKEEPKGLKKLSDQAKNDNGNQKGLKGLSDQSKAADNAQKGNPKGGLKGLSDQQKK